MSLEFKCWMAWGGKNINNYFLYYNTFPSSSVFSHVCQSTVDPEPSKNTGWFLKFKWAVHYWANDQIVFISKNGCVLLMSAFHWLSCSLEVHAKLHKYQGKTLNGFKFLKRFLQFCINILLKLYELCKKEIQYIIWQKLKACGPQKYKTCVMWVKKTINFISLHLYIVGHNFMQGYRYIYA